MNDNSTLIKRLNTVAHDRRRATESGKSFCTVAFPTLDASDIERAESLMGFSLPPLLAQIYLQVGNGGFGPGYGFLPLIADREDDETVVGEYLERRSLMKDKSGAPRWPEFMLPILTHGCGEFSCLFVTAPNPPVLTFTLNLNTEESTRRYLDEYAKGTPYFAPGFIPQMKSLAAWLTEWLDKEADTV